MSWIQDGDANTKFFHICASNRTRKNRIAYFRDDLGNQINDPNKILDHTLNYFVNAFKTDHVTTNWSLIKNNPKAHNKIDLFILDVHLSKEEIYKVVFSFNPFKSPGSDGIYPFSYQKYCNIVGKSVIELCTQIFNTQSLPPEINNTYFCLIPKTPNANNLKNFRPIGLCNTIYKYKYYC